MKPHCHPMNKGMPIIRISHDSFVSDYETNYQVNNNYKIKYVLVSCFISFMSDDAIWCHDVPLNPKKDFDKITLLPQRYVSTITPVI
jgi:hypothetical protein